MGVSCLKTQPLSHLEIHRRQTVGFSAESRGSCFCSLLGTRCRPDETFCEDCHAGQMETVEGMVRFPITMHANLYCELMRPICIASQSGQFVSTLVPPLWRKWRAALSYMGICGANGAWCWIIRPVKAAESNARFHSRHRFY